MMNSAFKRLLPLLFLVILIPFLCGCSIFNNNLQRVYKDEFYRSGQMGPVRLGYVLKTRDIRTVINLRGASPGQSWYDNEKAVCDTLGVVHYDLDWSMNHLPNPDSLAEYLFILDHSDRPFLVHCQSGVHRAAIASAVFLLMQGKSLEDASKQIGPFFCDAPIGELLELYEGSELPFDQWLQTDYPALFEAVEGN